MWVGDALKRMMDALFFRYHSSINFKDNIPNDCFNIFFFFSHIFENFYVDDSYFIFISFQVEDKNHK